jgi:hypothetical protein
MNSFWTGRGWELAEAGAICVLFLILGLWFGLRGRDRAYDEGYGDGQADYLEEAVKAREAAGLVVVKRAAMVAWAQTHPASEAHLVDASGWLRAIQGTGSGIATTNLQRDPDDPYDPDEDAPYTVIEEPPGLTAVREAGYAVWDRRAELWARQVEDAGEWAVPLEFPPAEPLYDREMRAAGMIPAGRDWVPDPAVWGEPEPPAEPDPASYEPAWEPWSLSEGTTVEEEVRAMIANANAAPSVRWLDSLEAAA